jgi:adenine phosphoribosyltransferase
VSDAIDRSLAEALVLDRKGYSYVVHPLMDGVPRCDPKLLKGWTGWAAKQGDILENADLLLAPEAMGLPLVAALSLRTGIPYAVIRKRQYGLPGEEVAYCETGYGESCLHVNDVRPGEKVVLVDDVVSTGRTLDALLGALAGMKAKVNGVLVFADKGKSRATLEERHGVPVRAMKTLKVVAGKVRLATE